MADEHIQQEQREEKKCTCPVGAPAWMVTYSDLVTLLLTFFVLLLSMANMDPIRFLKASSSIQDALGVHTTPAQMDFTIPIIPAPPISKMAPVQQHTTKKLYEKIQSQIGLLRLSDDVAAIKRDDDSIVLRVSEGVLFKPGEAQLSLNAYPTLRTLAEIINPLPVSLRIEGHTDDIQVSKKTHGNWDLSVNRSVSVLRFFYQGGLLALDRMAAVGYGKDRPLVANKDEAARTLNRRVDFVLRLKPLDIQSGSTPHNSTIL